MGRIMTMTDDRVGQGTGDFYKPSNSKDKPDRIALVPIEITLDELTVNEALKQAAKSADKATATAAQEKIEDIQTLKNQVNEGLQKKPNTSQLWETESGQKVIIFPGIQSAKVFWIDNVGYVHYIPGIPEECLKKPAYISYACAILQYKVDDEGNVLPIAEANQISLGPDGKGGEHKLHFKYTIKPFTLNDTKVRTWKEAAKKAPLISRDFLCWTEKQGTSDRIKFLACDEAEWRANPGIMRRILREGRKTFDGLVKNMAKDHTLAEICQLFNLPVPGAERKEEPEQDFSALLGGDSNSPKELNFDELLSGGTPTENKPDAQTTEPEVQQA
jgi:hypothetical protein